ncbi:MAG TPA: GNAT family N-acetyltransferase [Vicinamibacterales bacterium]|nr:GNAT family N-acetyltransferase [Vicinamibacterales bacterium]
MVGGQRLSTGTRIIRSVDGFAELERPWNELADRTGNPLLRHEWFASCAETLVAPGSLAIVIAMRDGQLVGAAPLATQIESVGARLEFLGVRALYEPCEFLFSDAAARDDLCEAIAAQRQPVVLRRAPADPELVRVLRRMVPWPGQVVTRTESRSLFVPIHGSWTEYARGLSSHLSGNLRRLRNKLGREGTVSVDVLSPSEAEADSCLEMFMEVEDSGWKADAGGSLRRRPPLHAFFRAYTRRAARAGLLRVAFLRAGARVVAAEVAIEAYRRWWQLKIGYLHEMAGHYPGLQLCEATIRHAFERGLESYEFLGVAANWERRWGAQERTHQTVLVYPGAWSGARAAAVDGFRLAMGLTRRVADWRTG